MISVEMVPVGVVTSAKGELRYSPDFRVMLDDRELCRSTAPFVAAAVALLAEGVPSDTVLEARHRGSDIVAMRATLETASAMSSRYLGKANSGGQERV